MTFLTLQPLSAALLPAALVLDQRCFGGLWTLDGYQRELESPNSELLVLIEAAEEVGGAGEAEDAGEAGEAEEAEEAGEAGTLKTQNSLACRRKALLKTQNSSPAHPTPHTSHLTPHTSPPPHPTPHTPHPTPAPLLGLGCYWAILEEAHITMLAIDPTYQHQGLGQALLYALMASAHARGLERATLEVRLSNEAARSLYRKFDFREAGRRRRYYPDDGEDALVLWRGGLQTPEFSDRLQVWYQQVCQRLYTAGWQFGAKGDRSTLDF